MAQIEPMDIDIDSDFDNKENSLHHSNLLPCTPCTEKGYEELDVSELSMKLRYSITPASSPMSKSVTVNSLDNRTFDSEDYINNVMVNENCNLTRSLNSTITRNDVTKLPKSLPLQVLSTESVNENKSNSVLRTLEKTIEVHDNDATITLSGQNYLDDNMSLPSTSSSVAQTPEATTPTKEIPKHDGGSPIMRGIKSVLNMFRSSQSPIPPADVNVTPKQEILSPKEPVLFEEISKSHLGMASTPISNKQREISSSQRNSPLKESIVFNDDLERELQWKDETTILFKEEKIPIHKLLLPQSLSSIPKTGGTPSASSNAAKENFNRTVDHMDISYSDLFSDVRSGRHIQSANITYTNDSVMAESDGEFVDCETTINNDDISDNKIMKSLTSSMNSQNISLQQSQNMLQIHAEQPIAINKSATHLQTKCDKNDISTACKEDCTDHEIFIDSVIKTRDMKSNMDGGLLAENQNKMGSEFILENNSEYKLKEFSETEHTSMGTILGEDLSKCIADAKHPSDIPLPDEDDGENGLNIDLVTMTTKQQELKLKANHQMDMSIDHSETSMINKICSSESEETKKQYLDSIGNNDITIKEIDQERNNQEIENTQCTNTKENIQLTESNDNLTLRIENAPLEQINSINLDNGQLNLEINSKIMMHSLEPNNGKGTEAIFVENKTKFDLNINQRENNTLEHESTFIFEEKNSEKIANYLGSNNTFCSINNDVKECSSNQIELNFDNNQVCILASEDTTTASENIAIESSSMFMQEEKNFEININIPPKVQEDMEIILQSQCSLKHLEAHVMKDNAILADSEKTCNIMENVEIITLGKEMFDIDSTDKLEHLTKEEGEETLPKEVINTTEENSISKTIESEMAINQNVNELSMQISPTNETFNMSLGQGDLFKSKEDIQEGNLTKEERKETLSKEIINTSEENCNNKTMESEMAFKQNVNELSMQISPTNETFNMSLGQGDLFKSNPDIQEGNLTKEESKETLSKEVINTTEENSISKTIESEMAFKQNVNELSMQISPTNETFNMSLGQGDLFKSNPDIQEGNLTKEESKETLSKEIINTSEENCNNKTMESEMAFKQNVNELSMQISPTNETFNMSLGQGDLFKSNEDTKEGNLTKEERKETLSKEVINTTEENCISKTIESEIAFKQNVNELSMQISPTNETFNMSFGQGDLFNSNKDTKEGNLTKEECKETLSKEVINIREENGISKTMESEMAFKQNVNELSMQISATNKTFDMSLVQGDLFKSNEMINKTDEVDHDANISHIHINDEENKIIENSYLKNIIINETDCNTELVNHNIPNVTTNAIFNMNIIQEDEIENKTKEKAYGNESVTDCSSVLDEQIIRNVTLTPSNDSTCQKKENEDKENERMSYECEHKIDAKNINRENNLNVQLISSNSKIDDHIISHNDSNATFNMSIDQEDISESKEIEVKTGECGFERNALNICPQENEIFNGNNLSVAINKTGEDILSSQKENTSNLNIDQLNSDKTSNAIFNIGINKEDISESKEITGSIGQSDFKTNVLSIDPQENEIFNRNNRDDVVLNETGEGTINSQKENFSNINIDQIKSNKTCNATFKMGIDQEDIIESKENKESTGQCEFKTNVLNICPQENEILNISNRDGVVNETEEGTVNSQKENVSILNIDASNCDKISNATFNMGIDQEDSESKEIKRSIGPCDFKTNVLNICPQENEILNSDNRDGVVINETEKGTLNPQERNVSNSNIDLIDSNKSSNATFEMCTYKEDMAENKEIKEKTDECEPEADEAGECAIKKQNVIVSHSKLNDCPIFNATFIANDQKEENISLSQMRTKSEENTEPIFLPKRRSSRSENESLKADVIDENVFLDNTDCEIKNDQFKKVAKLMNTSLRTSKVLFQNGSDKVESESLNEKSVNNIELSDSLKMEIKGQEPPPLSPVISSKGYNFNFDEIDDPFATKTSIRSSPPPEDCTRSNEKGITKPKSENVTKKDFQRRKSMPVKRQLKSVKEKNKINSTFSEAVDYCSTTTKEMKAETAIANATCDNLQVLGNVPSTTPEKSFIKTTELPPCETEDTHTYINEVRNNENVDKSEVHCKQIETSSHEAEMTSNFSNSTLLAVNKCEAKNVFNLPEMSTEMNFSPFVTKSKVCRTPSPILEPCSPTFKVPASYNEPSSQAVNPENNIISDVAKLNVGNKTDCDSSVASSSSKGTEDATVREVNTEDEDTVEGPFFEADELKDDDKVSDIVADTDDMMNFNDLLPQGTDDNVDNGEMFIDAEAFEFLLNQNKSNMVVDSGKESLFLKFDPLFAKRMSSDGVLAALNKVQKRQSTPKRASKAPTFDLTYCDKTPTRTLNLNATTEVNSTPENTFEDPNTSVSKPMMVVNPAVNSIISPRNKPVASPPRANRRSLTFTSPAIAVIDRLLSLSGNNSVLNNETPTRQFRMEPNETDLTQLRELLADKEIHVNNLRMESKELKERLSTLETQVKSLESESEQRLKKVNELNERLVEKTNINRNMAAVVEEYERTIASLIAETEQDKKRHAEERMRLVKERDEQTAHLASMEYSFNDLHSKYEKSKQIILACKSNEDTYKKSIKEFEESLLKMQNNYELLKQHATSKLNQANQELERLNRAHNAEVVKLNAMIKRKDLHITSLEDTLAQKTKANEELTAICDELINKVG